MAMSLTTKDDINAFVALYTAHGLPRVIHNTGDEKCVSKRCWQSTIIICASHNQKRKTGGITVHIVGTWCSLTKAAALIQSLLLQFSISCDAKMHHSSSASKKCVPMFILTLGNSLK